MDEVHFLRTLISASNGNKSSDLLKCRLYQYHERGIQAFDIGLPLITELCLLGKVLGVRSSSSSDSRSSDNGITKVEQ